MKNIWQKLPAWIKAILLNIVLLFPIVILNQLIVQLNLKFSPQFGWGLLLVLATLYLYWNLVRKWNPFKGEKDIKLSLAFDLTDFSNILDCIGLGIFTFSIISLGFIIFDVQESQQLQFIYGFSNLGPLTAIPLLLALALTAGLVEEVTYRGFIQNTTHKKYSRILSYVIIGSLFSLLHFLPWPLILPYALVSIAYSIVADRQRSIGLGVFTHSLYDFIIFLLIYSDFFSFDNSEVESTTLGMYLILLVIGIYFIVKRKMPVVNNDS
ncbi:lysostaphin resistance A-like protein [Maribacter sp. 2304DJ31-5]|uniref:CPBP family intramembrane glutamic endopeptidase n=1 Tax=Maribacter sp. 2304DJ31-5 TaxID=3386273 RepID=UPI0039BD118E